MNTVICRMLCATFVLSVVSSPFLGAEKPLESPIAQRLVENPSLGSPFHVIFNESGRVSVEAGSIFTEGNTSDHLTLPKLISNPGTVELPSWVIRELWQGTVVIALSVRENGTVGETLVMTSSGNGKLDRLAEETLRGWRFEPAMKDGKPVYECVQISIIFEPKA